MIDDNDALNIWTVYKSPKDYPDKYVARLWKSWQGGGERDRSLVGELGAQSVALIEQPVPVRRCRSAVIQTVFDFLREQAEPKDA